VYLHGLGIDSCREFVYLVLEKCDSSGWTFVQQTFSKRVTFPAEILLSWADLASGCHEMAKQGILHRDLTLDNILVVKKDEKYVIKVCDFGVSGTHEDYQEIPRGKMRNYPPEAIKSEGAGVKGYLQNEKSDVYMMALVMWEMLHNKLVWN
jgi:serine/threonine protein kinase